MLVEWWLDICRGNVSAVTFPLRTIEEIQMN